MRGRAPIEALLLSFGALACLLGAGEWVVEHGSAAAEASITDPRLWSAAFASLKVGLAVGLVLALGVLALAGPYLASDRRPPVALIVLAAASALTPDLLHAMAWRSALQPDSIVLGGGLRGFLAGDPRGQFICLSAAIAVKWLPILSILVVLAMPRARRVLHETAILAGVAPGFAFRLAFAPYLSRSCLLLAAFGVILGFRQHEFSDALFAGGAGLRLEGLSQWSAKVALSFLDPGRASVQVLSMLLTLAVAAAVLQFVAVRSLARGS